jgi:hypothetical protein
MFTSITWRLKTIKLHHRKPLQVAHQKNVTIRSVARGVEHAQRRELNAMKDSFEDLDAFPYLELIEIIADSESQPSPQLPQMDIFPGAGAPQIDYIA